LHDSLIREILTFTKGDGGDSGEISYPGENTLKRRMKNEKEGIPVNEKIWESVRQM
jgi:3-dehydro-L-gulonate 2-dehydrogenase